jgi:hypothetical protein
MFIEEVAEVLWDEFGFGVEVFVGCGGIGFVWIWFDGAGFGVCEPEGGFGGDGALGEEAIHFDAGLADLDREAFGFAAHIGEFAAGDLALVETGVVGLFVEEGDVGLEPELADVEADEVLELEVLVGGNGRVLGVEVVEDVLQGVEIFRGGVEAGVVVDAAFEAVRGGYEGAVGGVGFGGHGGLGFPFWGKLVVIK